MYDDANSTWQTWNVTVGNITDGLIAPFQGFFIQGSGGSGSLTIEEADISSSEGSFLKRADTEPTFLKLNLSNGDRTASAFVQFDENSRTGIDDFDGLSFTPLTADYLQVSTLGADGSLLNINALPDASGTYILPIDFRNVSGGVLTSGEGILSWDNLESLPAGWSVTLTDDYSGEQIDLRSRSEIDIQIDAPASKMAVNNKDGLPFSIQSTSTGDTQKRYHLVIETGQTVSIDDDLNLPTEFGLSQNFPNPFNPSTQIEFAMPSAGEVRLTVFDLLGREVATLVNGQINAGTHQATFDATGVASGLYLYRLEVNGREVATRKMTLVK